MIELKNVSKWYGSFAALRKVTLSVNAGDLVLFKGQNGAGKSTLFRILAGIEKVDEGSVEISKNNISSSAGFHQIKKNIGIGYVSADSMLYADLQIGESLGLIEKLNDSGKEDLIKSRSLCESLNLTKAMALKPFECSQGMLKKASLVACLLGRPKLILLDEPFSSLDSDSIEVCLNIIKDIKDKGNTVLIASHRNDYGSLFFDNVFSLNQGRVSS